MLKGTYKQRELQFRFDARTSRGRIERHTVWYLLLWDSENPNCVGVGEAAPLPGLSMEDPMSIPNVLDLVLHNLIHDGPDAAYSTAKPYPSVVFALETALLDLKNGGTRMLFPTPFVQTQSPIRINGLVWMADIDTMYAEAQAKVQAGFSILKFKIGAQDFDAEIEMLRNIRANYPKIEIRLDANGAFKPEKALENLEKLAPLTIHSVEQPLPRGHWTELRNVIHKSPIAIALDEELIGVATELEKRSLMQELQPHYLILKPTLLGGFVSCSEWIHLAKQYGSGWWLTSALESNIGLNAIAQFASCFNPKIPHGLGTGQLYHNNVNSPLTVNDGNLYYLQNKTWEPV